MHTTVDSIISLLNPGNVVRANNLLSLARGRNFALVYQSLIAKSKYYQDHGKDIKGWFYCTIDSLRESTALAYKAQRHAIEQLIELGLIEYRRMGLPARRYFRIKADVENILTSLLDKGREIAHRLNPKSHNTRDTKEQIMNTEESVISVSESNALGYKINRRTIRAEIEALCPCENTTDTRFTYKCHDAVSTILIKHRVSKRQPINTDRLIDNINRINAEIGVSKFIDELSDAWTVCVNSNDIHDYNAYFITFIYNFIDGYFLKKAKTNSVYSAKELEDWIYRDLK